MPILLETLTIASAHAAMKKGDYTPLQLANAFLAEGKKRNADINAYLEFYDDIDAQSRVADELFMRGKATMLTGIPIAVKDNILVKGKIASGASKILANHVATYDATVIEKLKEIGRASCRERV